MINLPKLKIFIIIILLQHSLTYLGCPETPITRNIKTQIIIATIEKIIQTGRLQRILEKYIFAPGTIYPSKAKGINIYLRQIHNLLEYHPDQVIQIVSAKEMLIDLDLICILPLFCNNYEKFPYARDLDNVTKYPYYSFLKLFLQSVKQSLYTEQKKLIQKLRKHNILVIDKYGNKCINNFYEYKACLNTKNIIRELFQKVNDYLTVSSVLITPQNEDLLFLKEVQKMLAGIYVQSWHSPNALRTPNLYACHQPQENVDTAQKSHVQGREDPARNDNYHNRTELDQLEAFFRLNNIWVVINEINNLNSLENIHAIAIKNWEVLDNLNILKNYLKHIPIENILAKREFALLHATCNTLTKVYEELCSSGKSTPAETIECPDERDELLLEPISISAENHSGKIRITTFSPKLEEEVQKILQENQKAYYYF